MTIVATCVVCRSPEAVQSAYTPWAGERHDIVGGVGHIHS